MSSLLQRLINSYTTTTTATAAATTTNTTTIATIYHSHAAKGRALLPRMLRVAQFSFTLASQCASAPLRIE
jgi:hypothetical protein